MHYSNAVVVITLSSWDTAIEVVLMRVADTMTFVGVSAEDADDNELADQN